MLIRELSKKSFKFMIDNWRFITSIIIIKFIIALPFSLIGGEGAKITGTIVTLLVDLYFFGFFAISLVAQKNIADSYIEAFYGFLPLFSASLFYSLLTLAGLFTIVGAPYLAARFLFLPLIALLENPKEGRLKRATILSKNQMWIGVLLFFINFTLGLISALIFDGLSTPLFSAVELSFLIIDLFFDIFLIFFYMYQTSELSNAS